MASRSSAVKTAVAPLLFEFKSSNSGNRSRLSPGIITYVGGSKLRYTPLLGCGNIGTMFKEPERSRVLVLVKDKIRMKFELPVKFRAFRLEL